MIAEPVVSPDDELEITRLYVQSGLLHFTQYHFYEMYKRKYQTAQHHRIIADALDKVIKGEIKRLIINIGPRFGKTELAVKNFIARGLAVNPSALFIHLSGSDSLALDNSDGVRSIVTHESYQRLFPNVQISKKSKAKKQWKTTAGGGLYATATAGQVTGFGAGHLDKTPEEIEAERVELEEQEQAINELYSHIGLNNGFNGALIIDDPIKPDDADSTLLRDKVNNKYDSTVASRTNSINTPIIIIMQRLHENDLCGYILESEPGEWTVISLPAIQLDEQGQEYSLWPAKFPIWKLQQMRQRKPLIFGRQYMQNPMPKEGMMYGVEGWNLYQQVPPSDRIQRKAYIDTADTGDNYLCCIIYDETEDACYVQDVYYTQDAMEVTEPETAKRLTTYAVDRANIESNNGGRGFSRNVTRFTRLLRNLKTIIIWFHQSGNKEARIYAASASVKNIIYVPHNWAVRWPEFYRHVTSYMKVGKNQFDDGPDCLTGVVENFGKGFGKFEGADNS